MSRRRYLSTDISTDPRVNKLATQGGDFAVMLYTWMIPHCADDATISGDPDELLMSVIPGRRDKSAEDIAAALTAMDDLGLVTWSRDEMTVTFPASAFYKYQTYIPDGKRRGANNTEDQRTDEDNSADQRKTPQKRAYPSPSPSVSPSPSPSVLSSESNAPAPEPPKPAKSKAERKSKLPEDWTPSDKQRAALAEQGYSRAEIDAELFKFQNFHLHKGDVGLDWGRAFLNWMARSRDFAAPSARNGNGHAPPNGNGPGYRPKFNAQGQRVYTLADLRAEERHDHEPDSDAVVEVASRLASD